MYKFLSALRILNVLLFLTFITFIYFLLYINSKVDEINYQIVEVDYLLSEQYLKIKNLNTVLTLLSSHKNILNFANMQNNYGYKKASFTSNYNDQLLKLNLINNNKFNKNNNYDNDDIFASLEDSTINSKQNITKNSNKKNNNSKTNAKKIQWSYKTFKGIKK
ncbi:MAG: hypothetical protein U1E31_00720 [Rickettsiales bacterium]